MDELRHIPVTDIVETDFPLRPVRRTSVEYRELVDSVKDVGILQPLLVRRRGDKFEVVEGTYRLFAARECRLETIPCLIRDLSDSDVLSMQLQANAVRPATRKVEFAERLYQIMEEKDLTLPQLCGMLHKSTTWLRSMLMLRKLSGEAREMVNRGEISVKAGDMLARLPHRMQGDYLMQAATWPADEFIELARMALKNFREYVKSGRTDATVTRLCESMPWLRQMKELRHEAKTCERAGTVIAAMGGTSPVDGWRACLAWILHLDPESVTKQIEKQEYARHERLNAVDKRKADRDLRDQLITLRKSDE